MKNNNSVCVVATDNTIAGLTAGAAAFGDRVLLIYAGEREAAVNAEKAYYLGPLGMEQTFAVYVDVITRLVKEEKPDIVLLGCDRDSRLAAAFIAAACSTSAQVDAAKLWMEDGKILTEKMVYGGAAIKIEKSADIAVVCVGDGVFSAKESLPVENIIDVAVETNDHIRLLEKRKKEIVTVDLRAAKKIIGVGRGLADESDLEMCNKLASTVGAEIGCTRPICEERHWMPREMYIGVSGVMVQPEFYLAVGISGQVQHCVGVNKAGIIAAIDKNESAPIFKNCDYGIVGDLKKILPAMQRLLEK